MRAERGAIIIQVAAALLALTAFSAIVLDYGILWTSKNQAQNAADAGALSAAIHLRDNPTQTTVAIQTAKKAAEVNAVWNEANAPANVLVDLPITCPPGVGTGAGCVRVDVLRGARDRNSVQHTNYLPTIFARLVGVSQQGVLATATAQVTNGNAVQCVKPWIVADKWRDVDEHTPPSWDTDDTYSPPVDTYSNPGFDPRFDTGLEMPLKPGNIGTWTSGWAMEIDFGCVGSDCYRENIEGCPSWVPTVAIWDGVYKCDARGDTPDPAKGCLSVKTGMSAGPTSQGVGKESPPSGLVGLDPNADWTPTGGPDGLGHVINGCMDDNSCLNADGQPVNVSPRIVPIAVFDTAAYYTESSACSGGGCVARVTNLMGFFIEGMCDDVYPVAASRPAMCGTGSDPGKTVLGRLMRYPGQGLGTGGPTTSSFIQYVRLVR